jgi:hypothetical protein
MFIIKEERIYDMIWMKKRSIFVFFLLRFSLTFTADTRRYIVICPSSKINPIPMVRGMSEK